MTRYIVILVLVAGCAVANTAIRPLAVGDGQIDGRKIAPYELTWRQCSFVDGKWIDVGNLTEQVATIGERVLRLRHIVSRSQGPTTVATTYFDRQNFAPERMELEARMPDGGHRSLSVHELSHDGYVGWSAMTGERQPVRGKISSRMLHGGVMGLPLATLAYQDMPLKFSASMMSFDGTYDVTATWVGKELLHYDGKKIEAWLVDVEWQHLESGDVYAPGPEASGGRYWLVADPPPGFPYVPRYKTDSYAVEFIVDTCPDNADGS